MTRTIVLGAGVIGVTTAYYLAREGHQVTVVDQRSEVGQDATAGNAGLIAPGHSFAWASPQAPSMLYRSLRGDATAIRVSLRADPRFIAWGMQFLRECTSSRARENTLVKLALCQYSQVLLNELAAAEKIDYQQVNRGAVYLYRDHKDLELGIERMSLLRDHGQKMEVLDGPGLARLDPAFASASDKLAGAIHGVTDGSGNSELFTKELAARCAEIGVEFELGVSVLELLHRHGRTVSARTSQGDLHADNYVIALGVRSPFISQTVRQYLPIYPAKGYSLTVPVASDASAPRIPGVDEKTLVAWSRFGSNLRMSSTAHFDGYSRNFKAADFANILTAADQLFPDAADWSTATMRSCLRPMTPDGPPIIARSNRTENLYYNTGHGHMGWTMACGSGRAIADVISGRATVLDMSPFRVRIGRL